MTPIETDRIASAVNALRPDWPVASIRTLIETRMTNRSRRDVAVALTWVACDSTSLTPARVLEAGPWWTAVASTANGTYRPPRPDELCRAHGDYAETCKGCAADRLAGDRTEPRADGASNRASEHAAEIRAFLARRRAGDQAAS